MTPRSSLMAAAAAALALLLLAAPAGALTRVESVTSAKAAAKLRAPKVKRRISIHGDPFSAFKRPFGSRKPSVRAHAAAAAGLATTWCGSPRTTDYTASSLGSLPQIKVVYAVPAGSPNRFASLANWIQADVARIADRVAAASGSHETLRFDVGTNCANPLAYVDIATLSLSRTAAQLQAMSYVDRFSAVRADVLAHAAQLNATGGIRHFAVFTDDSLPATGDRTSGVGERPKDDLPDPGNQSNGNGLVATIFGEGGNADFIPPPAAAGADRSDYMLHEITHTLGAVQLTAPHSSGQGHCWDDNDVMCYNDGGPYYAAGGTLRGICGASFELIDCNGDDYFAYTPAAGSYLTNHWNAARSTFLCPLPRCQTPGAPPTAKLSIPSSPPSAQLVAWSGAPFALSAAGSTDDSGIGGYDWDVNYDGHFEQTTGGNPNLTLTYRDQVVGVPQDVRLGVGVVDIDGAISTSYVRVPIYPPKVFLGGTRTRQKLKTVRRKGIAYTVYGGGGTVRITATVTSSVKRRLHLSSRTLGRTRTLPYSTQLKGHLRFSTKVRRRLAHARSVTVRLTASLKPIGVGERRSTDRATIRLR